MKTLGNIQTIIIIGAGICSMSVFLTFFATGELVGLSRLVLYCHAVVWWLGILYIIGAVAKSMRGEE
jgi:hypothetical protein